MIKFNLQHQPGYFLDKNKQGLNELPGIYVVYKCDYDSKKHD